jgi:hypothetical protein
MIRKILGHDRVEYRARHPSVNDDLAEDAVARRRLVVVEGVVVAADLGELDDVGGRDFPGAFRTGADERWTVRPGRLVRICAHVLLPVTNGELGRFQAKAT